MRKEDMAEESSFKIDSLKPIIRYGKENLSELWHENG